MELVALVLVARSTANLGDVGAALADAARGVEIARELRDTRTEGWALLDYGRTQRLAGRHEDALVSDRRATTVYEDAGVLDRLAWSLDGTGTTFRKLGRRADAVPFHRQAAKVARETSSPWVLSSVLGNLVESLAEAGDDAEAVDVGREAAGQLAHLDDPEAAERLERIRQTLS